MYVIMMKTRLEEFKVSSTMNQFFSDDIIPLFEILIDEYQKQYKRDPITGELLYEIDEGKTRRHRVLLPSKPEDLITLKQLNARIGGKKAFIDFYRFDSSVPARVDPDYAMLPLDLRNFQKYKNRLFEVSEYPNFIPVISIKPKSTLRIDEIESLITSLKKAKPHSSIAVRIDIREYNKYQHIFENLLDNRDYFFIDIGIIKLGSLKDQIKEISKSAIKGTKILLNSPRKSSPTCNADYEEEGYTDLINCEVNRTFRILGFQGFGDYGGLKNDFPTVRVAPKKASALALLFDMEVNKYMSFMNPDDNLKLGGYEEVVKRILNRKEEFDPIDDCPAMKLISNFGRNGTKYGNWASWNRITLTRTIHQNFKHVQGK